MHQGQPGKHLLGQSLCFTKREEAYQKVMCEAATKPVPEKSLTSCQVGLDTKPRGFGPEGALEVCPKALTIALWMMSPVVSLALGSAGKNQGSEKKLRPPGQALGGSAAALTAPAVAQEGVLTSGHWHFGCPGPVSLPPTCMSYLRQRKYQSETVRRRAPPGLPSLQSGAGVEERRRRGCKAVSESHRHSELVGVTGSPRHSQGRGLQRGAVE